MILYRIIPKTNINIINNKIKGYNSFQYDDNVEYIHFFILPENAYVYQLEYKYKNIDTVILKCDIPYNLIEFGVGLYLWYYRFKYVPFLEVRIKKNDFKYEYIKEVADNLKCEWKNTIIFKRYLINCIYNQKVFNYINKNNYIIELDPSFNFLHYFTENDLKNENITISDYPKNESLSTLNKKISITKKILIFFKEHINDLTHNEDNYINLKYYKKK